MKFTYPAIIRKQDNGTWKAWLPDLACCEAEAETLEEVIEKANAALYDWIELELSEDEVNLPPISDPMQQSMTGSVWSCLRTRRTFRLYPTWMTWTLSRAM